MGQIEDLRLFASIVEQGSISKAANKVHVAKSAVSRRLKLLEQRYGSRLIAREPGHWEITATGQELYQRALDVLTHADEIEDDFTQANQTLAGPLVVSVPREFGLLFLNSALMAFKIKYPEIRLMVDFDDRKIDLSRDNYDFAIRITSELEPNVVAKHIGSSQHRVFASPAYLANRGTPKNVDDLRNHDLLQFGVTRRSNWTFTDSERKVQVHEFQPSLNSNSGMFLVEAASNGLGIAKLPDFICHSSIVSGDLIPILSEFTLPELQIYLIYSHDRRFNRRMGLFAKEMEIACGQD